MGNIMTSFYTGVSGMHINQTGLNTTAHNLANVNTKGYTRQQVEMKDFLYNNIGYTAINTLQVGLGGDMMAIRQVRNTFLDRSYRTEVGRGGFYDAQYQAVMEVEDLFGELEGEDFQSMVGDIWTALQELTKEPESLVNRAMVLDTAVSFMERADNIYNQLVEYQVSLNTLIRQQVDRINEIGDEIHKLNATIVKYESTGENANDYRDARNYLLDELSGYAKISYSEDITGMVMVNLEGSQFVLEDTVTHLGTAPISNKTPMLKVVWENTTDSIYDLTVPYSTAQNTDIGSLKGILTARGDYQGKYTDIPVADDLNTLLEWDPVTEMYKETPLTYDQALENYNKYIDPSIIRKIQSQFDVLIHGVVTTLNDILCPNVSIADGMANLGVDGSDYTITWKGETLSSASADPAILEKFNKILIWDEYNAPVDTNGNSTREALFERKGMERYTEAELTYTDADGTTKTKTVYVYNEEDATDNYSLFTLGEIELNERILDNVSLLPINGNKNSGLAGAYDITICDKLAQAWNRKFAAITPNELRKSTFFEYYTNMIEGVSERGSILKKIKEKQEDMASDLDNQRNETAAVSSEEELSKLIKYQHAYNANSRYINVINEMLGTLIDRLGA